MDIFKTSSNLIERIKIRLFKEGKDKALKNKWKEIKLQALSPLLTIPFLLFINFAPYQNKLILIACAISILLGLFGFVATFFNFFSIYRYIKIKKTKNYEQLHGLEIINTKLNKDEIEELFQMNLSSMELNNIKKHIMDHGAIWLETLIKNEDLSEQQKQNNKIKYINKLKEKIEEQNEKEKNTTDFFNEYNLEFPQIFQSINEQIEINKENYIKEKDKVENNKEMEINKINLKTMI